MNGSHELFRVGGVAVKLQGSLLLLGILLAVLALSAGGTGTEVALRLLNPVLLIVCVVLHEIGHALVARRLGVTVIDIILGPMGGMARLAGELKDPKVEGLIALAGPTTNLMLATGTYFLAAALGRSHELVWHDIIFFLEDDSFMQHGPLVVFFGLNVLLGTVNLVPAFPSDGGRILRAALTASLGRVGATRVAARIGTYVGIFLILLPLFADSSQWWITPFIGFFLVFSCLKERIVVEAREGMGLSFGSMRFQMFRGPGQNSAEEMHQEGDVERGPRISEDGIIDVTAESRLIEDDEDKPS